MAGAVAYFLIRATFAARHLAGENCCLCVGEEGFFGAASRCPKAGSSVCGACARVAVGALSALFGSPSLRVSFSAAAFFFYPEPFFLMAVRFVFSGLQIIDMQTRGFIVSKLKRDLTMALVRVAVIFFVALPLRNPDRWFCFSCRALAPSAASSGPRRSTFAKRTPTRYVTFGVARSVGLSRMCSVAWLGLSCVSRVFCLVATIITSLICFVFSWSQKIRTK